jgi:hypothetical protein
MMKVGVPSKGARNLMQQSSLMVLAGVALAAGLVMTPASPVSSGSALAQAGATGGTIGKRGKSASGNESQPAAKPAAAPSAERKNARKRATGCGRVVGVWEWNDVFGSVETYRADGIITSTSNSQTGRWTCKGRQVDIHWPNGDIERQTASPDFSKLHYVNKLGVATVGTKRGGN